MNKKRVVGGILSAIGISLLIITCLMTREPQTMEYLFWSLSGLIFLIGLSFLLYPSLFQRYEWVGDIKVSKEAIEEFLKQ